MHHVHADPTASEYSQATLENDEFPTPICQFLQSFIRARAGARQVFIELFGNQDPANEEDLYGRHMTKQCI